MRTACALILVMTLSLLTSSALAVTTDREQQDCSPPEKSAALSHDGSSPWDPPEATDEIFVVDTAGGLDTGCSYRSDGPLVFAIPIDRYIGDPDLLMAATPALLAPTTRLRMPAWDVDYYSWGSYYSAERDRVLFNGHEIGYLLGDNQIWLMNEFDVPTEFVNFPTSPGQTAINTITIQIDTANIPNNFEAWCTAIDWAVLELDVARPVLFVHGIFSSSASAFSGPWISGLEAKGLPIDYSLSMGMLESIGDNASAIAARVAELRSLWHVDKINIVAHSKGGIDSRHYAETHDDIAQVIQIATPNAGSPLADAAQGALVVGGGLAGMGIVNALAGPGGVQLTTPYMGLYNEVHLYNPDVVYTAYAGVFEPDCAWYNPFCYPVERLLLAITGRGDTIVPEWSVHSLPYTRDYTYSSATVDATHTAINHSSEVFSRLQDEVAYRSKALAAGAESIPRSAVVVGAVAQTEAAMHSFPVDGEGSVLVSLMYPSGRLEFVLESPSGVLIDPSYVTSHAELGWGDEAIPGGRMQAYAFTSMEAGTWTAHITGTTVLETTGKTPYGLCCWLPDATLAMTGGVAEDFIRAGESFRMTASLSGDGGVVTNGVVKATILRPDEVRAEVTLLDDGAHGDGAASDGIFGGLYEETAVPGFYRVALSGSDGAAPTFSRESFDLVSVSSSHSEFNGTYEEHPIDTNGNGYYDELRIDVGLSIDQAGTYRLAGKLVDSSRHLHGAQAELPLVQGTQTVTLSFDGGAIFRNGVSGPYVLTDVWLAEVAGGNPLPVAKVENAYSTSGYAFTRFEHSPIWLTNANGADGVDSNGDGLFENLAVVIGVHFTVSGTYSWSARLEDYSGQDIGFADGRGAFGAGDVSLPLTFLGEPIGHNGVDGPYAVRDLLIYAGPQSFMSSQVFVTGYFAARDFVGFAGDPTPPVVTVTSPVANSLYYYQTPIVCTFSAEDPESGIVSLAALLDGNVPVSSGDELTINEIGPHQLIVRAVNGQGNDTIVTVPFEVVTTPIGGCVWSEATVLESHGPVYGVAWGDYDNDGDQDLFLARYGASRLFENVAGTLELVGSWPSDPAMSKSAVWGDYNNDGALDLYVVNSGQPNMLYAGDGHGGFAVVDAGDASDSGLGYNAAWGDIDVDKDLDLYLTNENGVSRLFRNSGGTFVAVPGPTTIEGTCRGCAFADYDNDRDLDLFVSGVGVSRLFANDGHGGFSDVTSAPLNSITQGKGVAWGDFDNDGDLDLYVAQDVGSNKLFANKGDGTFADVTDGVTGDEGSGRSCGWGDYDNNGWLDLLVANAAGGSHLFHNVNGAFADSTCGALADYESMSAWGSGFADVDNDGDLDLVLGGQYYGDPTVLLRNDLGGTLTEKWLQVDLRGVVSNHFGIGARVTVEAGDRKLEREVSASSSYLAQAPLTASFGLGCVETVDLTVRWPSGVQQIVTGVTVNQRLTITERPSTTGVGDQPSPAGGFYAMNYPNPFNPSTTIAFGLPTAANVTLQIYDVSGRTVLTMASNVPFGPGRHEMQWTGKDDHGKSVPSGMYFYRLTAGSYRAMSSMLLVK